MFQYLKTMHYESGEKGLGSAGVVKRMLYFAYEFLPQGVTPDSPAAALVNYLISRGVHDPRLRVVQKTAGPDKPAALDPTRFLSLHPGGAGHLLGDVSLATALRPRVTSSDLDRAERSTHGLRGMCAASPIALSHAR